jgi:hypothetical protein
MIDANFPNGDSNGSAAPPLPIVLLPFLLPGPLVAPLSRWYPLTIVRPPPLGWRRLADRRRRPPSWTTTSTTLTMTIARPPPLLLLMPFLQVGHAGEAGVDRGVLLRLPSSCRDEGGGQQWWRRRIDGGGQKPL